jgi:hypothetical protein
VLGRPQTNKLFNLADSLISPSAVADYGLIIYLIKQLVELDFSLSNINQS